jgi:hypothetical protein
VLAVATDEAEFRKAVARNLEELQFFVRHMEDVEPLSARARYVSVSEEILELAEEARVSGQMTFGTFHSYRNGESLS